WRIPSPSSALKRRRGRRAARAGAPRPRPSISAESAKDAASTTSAAGAPAALIKAPARLGPERKAAELLSSSRAFASVRSTTVTASPRTLTVCVVITTEEGAEPSWVPQLEDCSPALRRALERVGLQAGELWLHLLGIGLERGALTAAELVDAVAELAPAELR